MRMVFLHNTQSIAHGIDGSGSNYIVKANRCYVEVGLQDENGNRIDSVQQQLEFRCNVFDTQDPESALDVIDGNARMVTHAGSATFRFRLNILSGKNRRAFFIRLTALDCETGEEVVDGINTDSFIVYSKKPRHSVEHSVTAPMSISGNVGKKRSIKTDEGALFANDRREKKQAKTENRMDLHNGQLDLDELQIDTMTFESSSSGGNGINTRSRRTEVLESGGQRRFERTGSNYNTDSFKFTLNRAERYPSSYSVYRESPNNPSHFDHFEAETDDEDHQFDDFDEMKPGEPTEDDLDLLRALESTQLFASQVKCMGNGKTTMSVEDSLRQQVLELQRQLVVETECRLELQKQLNDERRKREALEERVRGGME
eukprot:TRINITY_DN9684_c0_g1_i1.p1 TRINITY_DN9684_c0_g1~~TRINITY_DN9684_c0_g1_i1.p1  ORF type:complete len:372 (-),score=99.63 TRINITY_DN9684_c0_g1_i1:109-1224(-)